MPQRKHTGFTGDFEHPAGGILRRVWDNGILSDSMTAKPIREEMSQLIQPVRPTKVSAQVAEQIIRLIKEGVFKVGERLPSEKELAELMGVSRASVREALAALEAVGIVEAKVGRGNFVRRSPVGEEEAEPLVVLESEAGCLEIMEARGAFDPVVASLAARYATKEDVTKLRSIYEAMLSLARANDFERYFSLDKEFHCALAEATHNRLIIAVMRLLVETMDQKVYREFAHNFYMNTPKELERVAEIHGKVLEAIAAGDPRAAARRMRNHWERMRKVYEA